MNATAYAKENRRRESFTAGEACFSTLLLGGIFVTISNRMHPHRMDWSPRFGPRGVSFGKSPKTLNGGLEPLCCHCGHSRIGSEPWQIHLRSASSENPWRHFIKSTQSFGSGPDALCKDAECIIFLMVCRETTSWTAHNCVFVGFVRKRQFLSLKRGKTIGNTYRVRLLCFVDVKAAT